MLKLLGLNNDLIVRDVGFLFKIGFDVCAAIAAPYYLNR